MTDSPQDWAPLIHGEELALLGGRARVRTGLRPERGVLLDIEFPAGVRPQEHTHNHDSFIHLVSGHLLGTVNSASRELRAGQSLLHPAEVPPPGTAVTTSRWLEFEAPPTLQGTLRL